MDEEPDQTIEILMTELDPAVMATFSRQHSRDGKEATLVSTVCPHILLHAVKSEVYQHFEFRLLVA